MTANLLFNTQVLLGECPVWNSRTGELIWVDIEKGELNILNPDTGKNSSHNLNQKVGCAIPMDNENFICGVQNGIIQYSVKENTFKQISSVEAEIPNNRFNDGKCDANGRLWLGSMDMNVKPEAGSLYCIDNNLTIEKKLDKTTISNGLAWSPDNATMYFIDTYKSNVVAYDYDLTAAAISNPRIIIEVPENFGAPDGMTIDNEGMLWIAHWGGSCVRRWNPKNGKAIDIVNVDAPLVASCTFGGENLDVLFITTASVDLTKEMLETFPLSGSIFHIKPGVKGMATSFFNLT